MKDNYLSPEVLELASKIQSQINGCKNLLAKSSTFQNKSLDEQEIRFRIGYKLHDLRKESGYTLIKVFDLTGVSASFLSEVENGKALPSVSTLVTLTNCYGINMSAFCALCEL